MATNPKTRLTEDEYLAFERRSEFRSEYLAGEVFAMTGATRKHNLIITNLVVTLGNQLRDRPYNVYASDMRVNVRRARHYAYPGVVVTCGEEQFVDAELDTLLNPLAIVEVLSDSTESYAAGRRLKATKPSSRRRITCSSRSTRGGSNSSRGRVAATGFIQRPRTRRLDHDSERRV